MSTYVDEDIEQSAYNLLTLVDLRRLGYYNSTYVDSNITILIVCFVDRVDEVVY